MAASNMNFYYGDLVIRNSQNIEAGEVIETDEDGVKIEGRQSMKKDHIHVAWPDRTGSMEKIAQGILDLNPNFEVLSKSQAKLYDRHLFKGEIVRRVGSEVDQLGYCSRSSVSTDVQVVGTQHVLTNVKSTDLEPQEEGFWFRFLRFWIDMRIGGWRIPFVYFMLFLYFHLKPSEPPRIGSQRFLTMKNSYNVVPLREWKTLLEVKLKISSNREDTPCENPWTLKKLFTYGFGYLWTIFCFWVISVHFVVWCLDSNVWSKGLNGISFKFLGRFFVFYCWCQIFTIILLSKTLKEAYFETLLCYFSLRGLAGLLLPNFHNQLNEYLEENMKYVDVNLGDKYFNFLGYFFSCYFLFKSIMMLKCIVSKGLRRSLKEFSDFILWREEVLVPEEKLNVEILLRQTRADVVWQDGTVEQNILSTKLYPDRGMLNEEEYFPGNHVLGSEGSFADFRSYDYGIVKKVDHPGRTLIIKWMKTSDTGGNPHPTEQEVSVYDIIRHPVSGRVVIGVSNLEPSKEEGPNEDESTATDDESPPNDSPLVPKLNAIEGEEKGANNQCTATPDSEASSMSQQHCAMLESSLSMLEVPSNELASEAIQEQPIDAEGQSQDVTEGNATANENLLEGIKEHDNMPKVDSPEQGVLSNEISVPDSHKYKLSIFQPNKISTFTSIVGKEIGILKSSLPDGIMVKCFEDRMDLFSVLIKGPKMTPYEDGLFFFDLQLPADYPDSPPLCHYVSYCKGKLNPNLYEEGEVYPPSVSLFGALEGEYTQMWTKETSNLLQFVVSLRDLILVSEPLFNKLGCALEKGTPLGNEESCLYNERVLLKLIEAMVKLKMNPPELFQKEISDHFQTSNLVERLERWVEISETWGVTRLTSPSTSGRLEEDVIGSQDEASLPEFPLIPVSKGFRLTLKTSLEKFKSIVDNQES